MDDNFENKIREVFDNTPDIPFDERAWLALENQLNTPTEKAFKTQLLKNTAWILLFLSLGYFMGRWSSSSTHYMAGKQLIIIDTIIKKHQIVIIDTVYPSFNQQQTSIKSEDIQATDLAKNSLSANKGMTPISNNIPRINQPLLKFKSTFSISSTLGNTSPFIAPLLPSNFNINTIVRQSNAGSLASPYNDNPIANFIQTLNFTTTHAHSRALTNKRITLQATYFTKKGFAYHLHQILPKKYGIYTKFAIQRDIELSFDDDHQQSRFAQIGIEAYFSPRISAVFGIGNQKISFKKEKDEAFDFSGFPTPTPESPEDIISEARGKFDLELMPFGINYYLRPHKKLSPYLGIGLYASHALKSTINYTFKRPSSGSYSSNLHNLLSNKWEIDSYWTQAGVSYSVGKHWQFLLDINTRFALKKGIYRYENPKSIGLNLGFGYYW